MTPLGHLSVSYLAGKTSQNISLPAIIIGGVLPDIDFLLFPFLWFNQFHRVITHNLLFIGLVTIIGMFISSSERKRMVVLSLLLGGVLHLFVDSCLDNNPSNGIGIVLLWPFYKEFFSPFNLFHPVETQVGWAKPIAFIKSSVWEIWPELPFYILAAVVFLTSRRKNSKLEFRVSNLF